MTPRQMAILATACVAGGIAILLVLLVYVKRRSLRIATVEAPLEDDLREMETRIAELSESLCRAEAMIADLRDTLIRAGALGSGRSRNIDSDRTSEIVRLRETGMDLLEIARRLDMPAGEVELVLNLHRCGKTGLAAQQ